MKLSDLKPEDVTLVEEQPASSLKLSDLKSEEVVPVEQAQLEAMPEDKSWSKTESAGQGTLQGITAGFSDELGGVLGAAQDKILGNPDNKSLADLYREYRDLHRGRNKQAEEDNKMSYLAGNIAGGVGGAVLAPALAPTSIKGAAALGALTGLGASDSDLTTGKLSEAGKATLDTTIGGGLGAAGGWVGKKIGNFLQPKNLESKASRLASDAIGLKPSKELATEFSEETGKVLKGSDITRGVGKTMLDEGALPMTGGASNIYDSTLQAIDSNYQKLNPIIPKVQQELNPVLQESVSQVGPAAEKAGMLYDKFVSDIPHTAQKEGMVSKLYSTFDHYKEKLLKAEGNLDELVKVKRELQSAAESLKSNIYNDPNGADKLTEAKFLKQMGGIVRQHVEDLAATVNPEASQQISSINKNLSNLYTGLDYSRKLLDKKSVSTGFKDVAGGFALSAMGHPILGPALVGGKYALEKATGNPLSRLVDLSAAQGLNKLSKAIQTPAGQLVQKAASQLPQSAIASPFAQQAVQEKAHNEATQLSSMLYNATDDSLKAVAQKFKEVPSLRFYGEHLETALNNNDIGEKDRAIFLILQNKTAKRMVTPESES